MQPAAAAAPPRVSVIIPNYNHARYLGQRIESVLGQSVRELEVILLDDCSPDDSRAVIARYAAQDARIRVVLNEQNSGSTFKQWNKGFALARGEYVWVAESDDYAEPDLLEKLLAPLEADQAVGLAYCDSLSIDENNELMPVPTWDRFFAELDPDLWKHDFTRPGPEMIREFMWYRNIIPNASAVLLRRSVLTKIGPADEHFKVLGDWMFWLRILAISNVSFVAQPLNYFRTHRNNVRSKASASGIGLVENTMRLTAMRQYGPPNQRFYRLALELLLGEWFDTLAHYQLPLARHRQIYQNMLAIEPGFRWLLVRAFRSFLFRENFSGLRLLANEKLFKSQKKLIS